MAQVLIRKLDDQVVAALKRRAAMRGRAFEQELRDILTAAAAPSPDERLALADRIRALSPPVTAASDSSDLVREDRDAR